MKICSKCKTPYDETFFNKRKNRKSGLQSHCKKCQKEECEKHRINNIDYHNQRKLKWYYDNQEKAKEKSILYRHSYATITPHIEQSLTGVEEYKVIDNDIYVRCKNCNEWFQPTRIQISNRINSINGKLRGENNFYCNDTCKKSCNIFNQEKYTKENKPYYNSNNKEWVKLVKEQDNYTCQICGCKTTLQAHHIIPVAINPLLAEDLDNSICLCKQCHIKVHNGDCSLGNLKRQSVICH